MHSNVPPPYYDDLTSALGYAFGLMGAALSDRRSGFHTPTVTNIALDGAPTARTVVLRHFDKAARVIGFHTDARSRKWRELQSDARLAFHCYDAGRKLQLRFKCISTVHHGDDVAHVAWAASRSMSRACYAQGIAPGASIAEPNAALDNALPEEIAFENFAVVRARFDCMEWLYLAAQGHRRAEFKWTGEALTSGWLAP